MDLLREHFGEQIISRFGPVNWSCDITPLDFFLFGYVKSNKVYAANPVSIQSLKQNITRVIHQLPVKIGINYYYNIYITEKKLLLLLL